MQATPQYLFPFDHTNEQLSYIRVHIICNRERKLQAYAPHKGHFERGLLFGGTLLLQENMTSLQLRLHQLIYELLRDDLLMTLPQGEKDPP